MGVAQVPAAMQAALPERERESAKERLLSGSVNGCFSFPFSSDCDYALGLRSLLLGTSASDGSSCCAKEMSSGPVFGFLCLILSLLLYRSPSESEERPGLNP